MSGFWIIAAFMSAIAVAFVAWPVLRQRDRGGRWPLGGIVAGLLIVPAAAAIYLNVTTWNGSDAASGIDPEHLALVKQLAARMKENPGDVEGWLLLGRTYLALQQFVPARDAFLEAWRRTPEPDNDLKLALAVSTLLADPSTVTGEPGRLIDDVLADEPDNQEALWYGGLVAAERGNVEVARQRWTTLLGQLPAGDDANTLRAQLASLDSLPGQSASASTASQGAASSSVPSTAQGPSIHVKVSLADGISMSHFGADARLFIFARTGESGPPLAVIQRPASAVPGEFTLTDANSMGGIGGRSLADVDEVTLVARISASGQATAQTGDIFAQATHRVDDGSTVELTIDQTVP